MQIDGTTALVTGAGHRVGRALALALAGAGADVVVHYFQSDEHAEDTAAEIRELGRRAVTMRADLADTDAIDTLVAQTRKTFGRLDVLVNSAATFERSPIAEISAQDWDRVMAVNLKAPFFLSRTAAPLLGAAGGVIVNVADLSAMQPWPSYAHHSVSKAGLVHLTRILARALAPDVRVNAIAPGTVLPPEEYTSDQVDAIRSRTPLGRIGSPDSVARALIYLIEDDFVTGETLVVDGGRSLG